MENSSARDTISFVSNMGLDKKDVYENYRTKWVMTKSPASKQE